MVFARNPSNPLSSQAGVRLIVSRTPLDLPGAKETFLDQVYVYELTGGPGRAHLEPPAIGNSGLEWKRDDPTWLQFAINNPVPATLRWPTSSTPAGKPMWTESRADFPRFGRFQVRTNPGRQSHGKLSVQAGIVSGGTVPVTH